MANEEKCRVRLVTLKNTKGRFGTAPNWRDVAGRFFDAEYVPKYDVYRIDVGQKAPLHADPADVEHATSYMIGRR